MDNSKIATRPKANPITLSMNELSGGVEEGGVFGGKLLLVGNVSVSKAYFKDFVYLWAKSYVLC